MESGAAAPRAALCLRVLALDSNTDDAECCLRALVDALEALDVAAADVALEWLSRDIVPPLLLRIQREPSADTTSLAARALLALERIAAHALEEGGWSVRHDAQRQCALYERNVSTRQWPPTDMSFSDRHPEWLQLLLIELPALVAPLHIVRAPWPAAVRAWWPADEFGAASMSVIDVPPPASADDDADTESANERTARHLILGAWGGVGASFRETEADLSYPPGSHLEAWYTCTLAGLALYATLPGASNQRMLILGLGGGTLAAFVARHWPQFGVDAVELDARVIACATQHFGLLAKTETDVASCPATTAGFAADADGRPCRVHHADALAFVARAADNEFDMVLLDVYTSAVFPPALLCSEFFQDLRRVTRAHTGSVLINAGVGADCHAVLARARDAFGADATSLVLDSQRADAAASSTSDAQENGVVVCGAVVHALRRVCTTSEVCTAKAATRVNALAVAEWRKCVHALPADIEPTPFELKSLSATVDAGTLFVGWRGVDVNAAYRSSQRRAERAAALSAQPVRRAAAEDEAWSFFD